MPGIVFYFENNDVDVWSGHNLDAWNYAIKAAGDIDSVRVINHTDQFIDTPDIDLDFKVVRSLNELNLSGQIVSLLPEWEKKGLSLWDFNHKTNWYVFGPASSKVDLPGDIINIPQAGFAALHSVHIASTVMLHRYGVISGSFISRGDS